MQDNLIHRFGRKNWNFRPGREKQCDPHERFRAPVRKSPTDSEADQLLELGGLKLAERLKGLHQDDLDLQKSAKELMKMLQTVWKSKFKRPSIRGLSWSE